MRLIFSILIILFAAPSMAQRTIDIEKIDVKAKRGVTSSGVTSTILDSATIASKSMQTFAELLSTATPLFIKSYGLGSMATVSFRGTAASHTAVEWNGINVNSPMLGQVDFSTMPVWFVDKVELLHGGSSLQKGGGALGGSVIMGSMPRWDKSIYGSAAVGVGSFGTYTGLASVGGGNRTIQVRARYIYQQAQNDFQFRNTAVPPFDIERQTNADYQKHGAAIDIFANAGKGHFVSINGWFHTSRRNLPAIMSYQGLGRDEYQTDNEWRIVGKWGYYGHHIKSELVVGFNTSKMDYFLGNKTDLAYVTNIDSRSQYGTIQNRYKIDYTPFGERTLFRGQLNFDIDNVSTLNHITREGYSAHRNTAGLSLSAHHQFTKVWSGFALLRVEETGQFMPSIGVQAAPIEGLSFKFNATRNFHRPTLNDMYWLPGGNPDLLPEKGFSGDISAQYTYNKNRIEISVSVTGYAGLINDWIVWRPSEYYYWSAENIKTVFNRGVELSASAFYTTSYGLRYGINASYGYTRTTNQGDGRAIDASIGKQLIYIPEHKINSSAHISYKWLYAAYGFDFTGERFTTSSSESTRHALPCYGLHNLVVGLSNWGFNLELKIDNLFDTQYQAILWRAMPGRSYSALLRYTF